MPQEIYEIIALGARWWFILLGVLIVLRAFGWLRRDSRRAKRRLRLGNKDFVVYTIRRAVDVLLIFQIPLDDQAVIEGKRRLYPLFRLLFVLRNENADGRTKVRWLDDDGIFQPRRNPLEQKRAPLLVVLLVHTDIIERRHTQAFHNDFC